MADKYVSTINSYTERNKLGFGAEIFRIAPRYCVVGLTNIGDPDMVVRHMKPMAMALGKHVDNIRFGYPLNGQPNTAYVEIGFDDFIGQTSTEMVSSLLESDVDAGKKLLGNTIIPLGLGLKPVTFDFESDAHLLIGGSTGSGKSVLLRHITNYMLSFMTNTSVLMIDPKCVEFSNYRDLVDKYSKFDAIKPRDPNIIGIISGVENHAAIDESLTKLVQIMDARYEIYAEFGVKNLSEFRQAKPANIDHSLSKLFGNRIVLVVDELADLVMTAGAKKDRELLISKLVRIAQKGRAAGVHMILATQRPSVNVVPGILKANMPARIALKCASGMDSQVIIDSSDASKLEGKGDALLVVNGKPPQRFQAPYVDSNDDLLVELSMAAGNPIGYMSLSKTTGTLEERIRDVARGR